MNHYPRHLGDYAKDTSHLSLLEHGAYTLLTDWYYASEKPVPDDKCERIAKAFSEEERKAVRSVLQEFFTLTDQGWTHGRVEREIAKYREKAAKAAEAANARWSADADVMRTHSGRNAGAMQTQCEGNASQEPIANSQVTTLSARAAHCPVQAIIGLFREKCPSLVQPRIVTDATSSQIAARWRQSEKHQTLDFWTQFFEFCEANHFLAGRVTPPPGRKAFRAGLDWIVKANNFAKIVNGNYDNQ